MKDFTNIRIKNSLEDLAEQLKTARAQAGISLPAAAKETGIRQAYLAALESADAGRLPAGLYGRNYLREYALFLKLDPGPLLAAYDQESSRQELGPRDFFVKRAKNSIFFLAIPKLAKAALIAAVVLLCSLYLFFYLRNLTKAPYLAITEPALDLNTASTTILVQGMTEPETKVFINGESVLIDSLGAFSLEINLKKGLNTLTATSQKRYSRTAEITRKLLVE